jgi:2-iminobutanoate/2-iminopropanoate deaminase
MREAVSTDSAPRAIGPYSQAIRAGDLLFVSGQIPLDPVTGEMVGPDIAAQTQQVIRNLGAVLEAAGASFDAVVRTTIFLTDLGDFSSVNEIYGTCFTPPAPARATVQVARLPRDARIEIDAIAYVPTSELGIENLERVAKLPRGVA